MALALLMLARASSVEYVRIPIRDADLTISATRVSGILREGFGGADDFGSSAEQLPPYRLHWDGQPPSAFLIDARTDEVLGASALSEATLKLNRNAVLWTPTACKVVMSPTLYAATRGHLAVKFEVLGSRQAFYLSSVAALVLFVCTLLAYVGNRLVFSRGGGRLETAFSYAQTGFFVAVATLILLMLFPGYPINGPLSTNTSDESNINSFAAALDRPEVFQRDKFLSERANFDWYTPLYVQGVRLFQWVGFRYDTHRAFLIFASTLLGLFGFQRLFGTLSGSSWFGFVAAVCLWFLKASYPPNESWSAVLATPRTAYTAVLPWVVLLAASHLDRPRRWWIPSALSSLLFYVHPVSSPALTGAILTGFLAAGRERWRTRCAHLLTATAAAIAVMMPYILIYARKYTRTIVPDSEMSAKVIQYAAQRLAPGYIDVPVFYAHVGTLLSQNRRYWLGGAAILLLIPLYRRCPRVRLFYGMLAGCCAVTFLIPLIDFTVAQRLHTLPFQIDLIRNVRYADLIVLAALALVLGEYRRLWEAHTATATRSGGQPHPGMLRRMVPHGAVMIGILVVLYYYRDLLHPTVRIMHGVARANIAALQGQHGRLALSTMELVNAVHALRRDDETVYGPLNFRQMYIPVAFLFKDLGALSYANPQGLVEAREALDRVAPYVKPPISPLAATEVARIMDAQILVFYSHVVEPSLLESSNVVFRSRNHVVLRVGEGEAVRG